MFLGIVLSICSGFLFAQTAVAPSTGDGSEENPYQIASLGNLYWIAAPVTVVSDPDITVRWSAFYVQTTDIDASETEEWFSNEGWLPIGNNEVKFTGSYDGQNHQINNLHINRGSSSQIGLWGRTYEAEISNLNFGSATISGDNYTGGLVGKNEYSTITGCNGTGSISGYSYVGGLVGNHFYSDMINCSWNGSINGYSYIGGLLGQTYYSTVSCSYSLGSITGITKIGGFIGYNYNSEIENCYGRGEVHAESSAGGFVGHNYSSTISNCYSTGRVYGGDSHLGGFVGYNFDTTNDSSYWDTETSELLVSEGGIGKSTIEMKTLLTFTRAGWDFDDIWKIDSTLNDGYPVFQWQEYGVGVLKEKFPRTSRLNQNYPNPLNPTTTISYDLPEAQNIALQIFDITGRLVETLYNGYKEAGHWDVTWNASDQSSGVYIYRLQVGDQSFSKKMVVLK